MANDVLHLNRDWTLGACIGEGGFGQVFEALDAAGLRAAVKLVRKAPGAERELLFVKLGDARNVVPVIDRGERGDQLVLVMPRADRSLHDLLASTPVPPIEATLAALTDIAEALADLDGQVVHRDLKPQNVLHLGGRWCLSDFGISRYAEATTATDTHKFALSRPYAGPERWRSERATARTDIYSFGIIAYEMLMGSLPFQGPEDHDFREQHLHQDAPEATNGLLPLRSLIAECLYKSPEARPSAANVLTRLASMNASPAAGALATLQAANHRHVLSQAEDTRRASSARTEQERAAALFRDGSRAHAAICQEIATIVQSHAPAALLRLTQGTLTVTLGQARLYIACPTATDPVATVGRAPITVIGDSTISVLQDPGPHGYAGRSHSLWFCDGQTPGQFAWFETAFMTHPLMQTRQEESVLPFSLPPAQRASGAISSGFDELQLAWPFTSLRPGDLDEFRERWIGWFAAASTGQLNRPTTMPERQTAGSSRTT